MEDVDRLLGDASVHLKESFALVMEGSRGDTQSIENVRQSTAILNVPWEAVLLSFRTAVLTAAYERYQEWYESGKRKNKSTDSSSRKKPRNASEREVPKESLPQQPSPDTHTPSTPHGDN
jgi:hypothetical protein